jgi:hypothetical protein
MELLTTRVFSGLSFVVSVAVVPSKSYHRCIRETIVDFPDPDGPTMAVTFPAANRAENPSRICTFGLLGYENATLLNEMSRSAETSGSLKPDVSGTSESIVLNNSVAAVAAFPMATIGLPSLAMFVTAIMTENSTTTMSPTFILPRLYCRIPNQKHRAKVPYMLIIMGDIMSPIKGAFFLFVFAALSRRAACCLASLASAPNATMMRIDENISKAKAEACSCTSSVALWYLMNGTMTRPVETNIKGTAALAMSVRSQLLMKATTYRPMVKANDWNNSATCCEVASWIALAEVVMRVLTLPGETVSITLTGWAKVARRYASRRAPDILSPLMRMQSIAM